MGHDLDVHRFFPSSHEWNNPHLRFFTHSGIVQFLNVSGFNVLEDRSSRFWSFPKQAVLERLRLRPILSFAAKRRPSLFCGGFFLIAEKRAQ
jgi:hypothetical protein